MNAPNFITTLVKNPNTGETYYRGALQVERVISRRETAKLVSGKLGFTKTQLAIATRGVLLALREKLGNGCACTISGIARLHPSCKGGFASSKGPWVKGDNRIEISAAELSPFKGLLEGVVPVNRTTGANPSISSVIDTVTGEFDLITGTNEFSITGRDLAPDADQTDEYVALKDKSGTEVKAVITESSLGNVVAHLESPIEAGVYTLIVYTRSGLGEEFGVKTATRKVEVK